MCHGTAHMGQLYTAPTPIAAWLKGELDARGWGVRTLAKRMDPENVEVARRAVNRVIHEGTNPSGPTRAAIARGFEIPESDIPSTERTSDDDDEESRAVPLNHEEFVMLGDLMARLGPTLTPASDAVA